MISDFSTCKVPGIIRPSLSGASGDTSKQKENIHVNSKYTSAHKLRPSSSCRAQGPINKKTNPPIVTHTKTAVRIPAPALSAVVIGANAAGPEGFLVPAFGSLVPFPPVAVDTGFEDAPRNFSITALII